MSSMALACCHFSFRVSWVVVVFVVKVVFVVMEVVFVVVKVVGIKFDRAVGKV